MVNLMNLIELEYKKMRDAYADSVISLADDDPNIVFVSADSGSHEREYFKKEGNVGRVKLQITSHSSQPGRF